MHIFLDATTISRKQSGTGVYTRNLMNALPALTGFSKLTVGASTHLSHPPMHLVDYQLVHPSPHIAINRDLSGNPARIQADIAFFPNYFMPLAWEIPSAVTIHDVSFLSHPRFYSLKMRTWYKNRIQHTLKNAGLLLTVSEASATAMVRHLGVSRKKILVHPPCYVSNHPIVPASDRKKTLLYLGNMEPKKNVLNLIEAFSRAGLTEYTLELAGKIHAPDKWKKQFLDAVAQNERVRWLGYLPDDEVQHKLRTAAGLVNISHIEGFGLPQADALAAGTPCLISNDPAMLEVSNGAALVTDPNSIADISDGLHALTKFNFDKAATNAMEVRKRLSPERYLERLQLAADRLKRSGHPVFPGFGFISPNKTVATVATMAYAATFNAPINACKLHLALPVMQPDGIGTTAAEAHRLTNRYPNLFSSENRQFYMRQFVDLSQKRTNYSQETVRNQHKRLLKWIGAIPWVRAVYYSGGTSHQNSLYDETDLDLFIVTRNDRVWLTYTLIRGLSKLSGKDQSCCSNYLVDEDAQKITWQRDYYTAFQLLFLRQVFRKKGLVHIRTSNSWIRTFFPNMPEFTTVNDSGGPNPGATNKQRRGVLSWLNLLVMSLFSYRWTRHGLLNRSGGLLWDAHRIKLHTRDHRPYAYKRYDSILKQTLADMHHPMSTNIRKAGNN